VIINNDNIQALKELEDNSIDSVVTDPPYGLSFMGKKWDYDVPSKELWLEVFRVLKPGGHLLSFGGSRTYHRLAVGIEDAGFEIRDQIMWVYGSGFPKSHNIGKAVDKLQGNSKWEGWGTALKPAHEPIVLARKPLSEKTVAENVLKWGTGGINIDECRVEANEEITERVSKGGNKNKSNAMNELKEVIYQGNVLGRFPANFIHDGSDEVVDMFPNSKSNWKNKDIHKGDLGISNNFGASGITGNHYDDTGSASRFFKTCNDTKKNTIWEDSEIALKPAHEPIILARKPLGEKTVAKNVLKWGTGGINIDDSRVKTDEKLGRQQYSKTSALKCSNYEDKFFDPSRGLGRFPANFIHDGSDEVVDMFPDTKSQGHWSKTKTTGFGKFGNGKSEYQGVGKKDKGQGSASRFFYCAKASKSERNAGLDGFEKRFTKTMNDGIGGREHNEKQPTAYNSNHHPTVKPIALMKYLCRLITPKNGVVLDPFMGSGTTGIACKLEGFEFVGIELDKEYFEIAKARIKNYKE